MNEYSQHELYFNFLLRKQTEADRLYMNETLKIKLRHVIHLKNMNQLYPKTNEDFDEEFLFYLLKSVFDKGELKLCSEGSSLLPLNKPRLVFVKGKDNSKWPCNY